MVLQLVGGEVSGASINDICFQIQGWATAVSCELERTGLTGRVRAAELKSHPMDSYESKYTEGKEGHVWRKTGEMLVG